MSEENEQGDQVESPEEQVDNSIEEEVLRMQLEEEKKMRTLGLFGEIESTKAEEVIYGLYTLYETRIKKSPVSYLDLTQGMEEENLPAEMLINSPGGDATDMFAIYDTMRHLQHDLVIKTFGIGKVMSAGVLLLAAGTKGQRHIGENCRVMIHGVASLTQGNVSSLQTEMAEIKKMQEMYIDALVNETKLTKPQLKRMMNKKVNIYISAKDAVRYGIADIIV